MGYSTTQFIKSPIRSTGLVHLIVGRAAFLLKKTTHGETILPQQTLICQLSQHGLTKKFDKFELGE